MSCKVAGVWNDSVVPDEPGGWTAPDVMPSVSSSGRREALTGGGTTTSESAGEGGIEAAGVIEKPAANGGEVTRSRSRGGGDGRPSWPAKSFRGVAMLRLSVGVRGEDTQGTTLVTTFERKEREEDFIRDWAAEDVVDDNAVADIGFLRL